MNTSIDQIKARIERAQAHLNESARADPAIIAVKGLLAVIERRAAVDQAITSWLPELAQQLDAINESHIAAVSALEAEVARLTAKRTGERTATDEAEPTPLPERKRA